MALKYHLSKYHILAFFYLVIFIISFIIPANASKTIGLQERYYDWEGYVHDFNGANLEARPLYVVVDNIDNWGVVRQNKTVYLPKRYWIEYRFYPERIVPKYVINNFSQINTLVTKVNTSVWYLTIPFSSNYYVSISDDIIDMGVFKRTTKVTVTDSNTTACGLLENISCLDYQVVPKVVNNDIRLYFNPQNFTNVVYPLFLTENTIIIDNATFWANQDCGDGYWSAYGGGSCATPLSSTIHANLSGYWDMESTTGTIEHGINRSGRFPNSGIAATWNGNTTLNYTTGQNWGNSVLLDGINDYLQIPDSDAFTFTLGNKATWSLIQKNNNATSISTTIFSKYDPSFEWILADVGSNIYFWVYDNIFLGYRGRYGTAPSNLTWHKLQATYDGGTLTTSVAIYTDDVKSDTNDFTGGGFSSMRNTTQPIKIAASSSGGGGPFNGSIDEVFVVSSGNQILSNSTYAPTWNLTFSNNTASAGSVIDAVKFNIYNLNVLNNTANISARQNGTSNWTLINSSYVSNTWLNQTYWNNTDFAVNVSGNGSSRAFIISMTYDESPLPPPVTAEITGYVNNTLGAFVDGALVTINGASALSRETYLRNNTDLCDFNMSTLLCEGTRQSGVNYTASSELQLIVFAHANVINTTADVIVNIDGVNVTYNTGRPLGGAEQSYKSAVIVVPVYSNYTVYFANYHHYEWREYPLVHGYYNLTSTNGTQSVLARQIGYADFTGSLNVTSNMTYNITLQEKETVSEGTVIDYSLVGAMLGGLLAFVLLRRKRKDDGYKYKRE